MSEIKYNIWHIDAYAGFHNYDGPEDCNIHKDILVNATYNKEDVIKMFSVHYQNNRCFAIATCRIVSNGAITFNNYEQRHNE